MMQSKLQHMLLMIAGMIIGVLGVEIVIRLWFPAHAPAAIINSFREEERGKFARYDSMLGWDGRENVENDFVWIDCRHHVRQNGFGYRGAAYDEKGKRNRRFVVLGDSFVWGFGVDNEDIFTAVLERKTNNTVEMVNLGVSGFGTDQEYLLWKQKGRRWSPDEVLLMLTLNTDLWDNMADMMSEYPKPRFVLSPLGKLVLTNVPVPRRERGWSQPAQPTAGRPRNWVQTIALHSAAANVMLNAGMKSDRVRAYLESHDLVRPRKPGYWYERPLYFTELDAELDLSWRTLFGILSLLKADVEKQGARLTVVIIPSIVQVYPGVWERLIAAKNMWPDHGLDPDIPNRRIMQWSAKHGIRVIDLLPGLRVAAGKNANLYYPVNLHWTADGHRVAADILATELSLERAGRPLVGATAKGRAHAGKDPSQ